MSRLSKLTIVSFNISKQTIRNAWFCWCYNITNQLCTIALFWFTQLHCVCVCVCVNIYRPNYCLSKINDSLQFTWMPIHSIVVNVMRHWSWGIAETRRRRDCVLVTMSACANIATVDKIWQCLRFCNKVWLGLIDFNPLILAGTWFGETKWNSIILCIYDLVIRPPYMPIMIHPIKSKFKCELNNR